MNEVIQGVKKSIGEQNKTKQKQKRNKKKTTSWIKKPLHRDTQQWRNYLQTAIRCAQNGPYYLFYLLWSRQRRSLTKVLWLACGWIDS